jgi:selenide,water dikinase
MARASGCTLRIHAGRVPVLAGARALALENTPGGGWSNQDHFGGGVAAEGEIEADVLRLLYDPQTSGGLLVSLAPEFLETARQALLARGADAAVVGGVVREKEAAIVLAP